MDEGMLRDANLETGEAGTKAEVVVFEIATAKLFIKAADAVNDRAGREEAEPDDAVDFLGLTGVREGPFGGELRQFVEATVGGIGDELPADDVVGHGADDADVGVALEGGEH